MSREPSSSSHRYAEALGRSGAIEPPPKPKPKPGKRKFRVTVEPKKKPRPARKTEPMIRMNEAAFKKFTTTTEALTANERALLREMRAVHPDAAGQALSRIQEAKRHKKENH